MDINNNRLRMDSVNADGRNGGLAYISDHNFTDASIKSGGTFTVSVDIVSTSSGGESRVIGFGGGSSLAELAALTSASPTSNPADVYFIYDNAINIARSQNLVATFDEPIFLNTTGSITLKNLTTLSDTIISLPRPDDGTLSVSGNQLTIDPAANLSLAGDEIAIEISAVFGDSETAFTSGTFIRSGANENYISLTSNLTLTTAVGERHAMLDKLQNRTLGSEGGFGFDTWQTANNAVGQSLDDDHDGDGVSNVIEYFIGGPNGNTTGSTPFSVTVVSGTSVRGTLPDLAADAPAIENHPGSSRRSLRCASGNSGGGIVLRQSLPAPQLPAVEHQPVPIVHTDVDSRLGDRSSAGF